MELAAWMRVGVYDKIQYNRGNYHLHPWANHFSDKHVTSRSLAEIPDTSRKNAMFNWFNAKEEKEFGLQLAEFVIKEMPVEITKKKQDKTVLKRHKIMQQLALKVVEFKKDRRLNVYKKAQLGNSFKWRLMEESFDGAVASELTNLVIKELG
ncbi:hypothetical protein ACO0LC_00090 [Undibacterium sp. JH2W]|uniref:hypothetical protein n=1 Tax=Undibacterium sp. JH2W TaxID=3413037 RepID=UPI003BF32C20